MEVAEFINDVYQLNSESREFIIPNYDKIMLYRSDDVLEKFTEEFDVTKEEAHSIFNETLKFLYLAHVGL